MHEVLAFSAILTAGAFLISSFAVFWPEYRAAQKRDAASTERTAPAAGAAAAEATGVAGTAASSAGTGQSGNHPRYNITGPEDMKRYYFNYPACPAQEEEEEKEGLVLAARD